MTVAMGRGKGVRWFKQSRFRVNWGEKDCFADAEVN